MDYLLYPLFAALAAVPLVGMSFFLWRMRRSPGARNLFYLALVVLGWLIFNLMELVDPTPGGRHSEHVVYVSEPQRVASLVAYTCGLLKKLHHLARRRGVDHVDRQARRKARLDVDHLADAPGPLVVTAVSAVQYWKAYPAMHRGRF